MDAEGLDFGEAFKLAMKELNREANSIQMIKRLNYNSSS
jgi:hypothetical protein